MFLLVPAYSGCPGSKAVKRSLLLLLYNCLMFCGCLYRANKVVYQSLRSSAPPGGRHLRTRGKRIVSTQRTTEVYETSHYRGETERTADNPSLRATASIDPAPTAAAVTSLCVSFSQSSIHIRRRSTPLSAALECLRVHSVYRSKQFY